MVGIRGNCSVQGPQMQRSVYRGQKWPSRACDILHLHLRIIKTLVAQCQPVRLGGC